MCVFTVSTSPIARTHMLMSKVSTAQVRKADGQVLLTSLEVALNWIVSVNNTICLLINITQQYPSYMIAN